MESAIDFWKLLIPFGLSGGALSHTTTDGLEDSGGDVHMSDVSEKGWRKEYTELWFQFLNEKGGKGVSKDTWNMVRRPALPYVWYTDMMYIQFLDFVKTVDVKFETFDPYGVFLFLTPHPPYAHCSSQLHGRRLSTTLCLG